MNFDQWNPTTGEVRQMKRWPEDDDTPPATVPVDAGFIWVHAKENCRGAGEDRTCIIHNPSDHHMRGWDIVLRSNGLAERLCEHSVGHPDPDSLAFMAEQMGDDGFGIHSCDGCCTA